MLIIRKEQMAVLEAHLDRKFRAGLLRHLKDEFRTELKETPDAELEKLITLAIQRARTYEVRTEQDITLYLDLMVLKGHAFDRDPKLAWAGKILNRKDLDGTEKMETIYGRLAALENREALPQGT